MGSEAHTRSRLLLLAGLLAAAGAVLAAHAAQVVVSPPVPTSPVKAKELAALLQTRKLEQGHDGQCDCPSNPLRIERIWGGASLTSSDAQVRRRLSTNIGHSIRCQTMTAPATC